MKKILVIGIKGMAGHMIYNYLKVNSNYEVFGIARNIKGGSHEYSLDVSDTISLQEIITKGNFDIVVNCIGILNRDAEDNPSKAIWFNSYFPHFLEEITKNSPTKIIQISTDCVFSGTKGDYTEEDFTDGIGFYSKSKALGEINNSKDLTIRTSIIGPELNQNGIGLFNWFMTRPENETLNGYSNVFWSGITTLELTEVILNAIEQQIVGLITVAPKEKIDKFNLLLLFNRIFRNDSLVIKKDDIPKHDKSLRSIRTDFNYEVKEYIVMLQKQKIWMESHNEFYPQY